MSDLQEAVADRQSGAISQPERSNVFLTGPLLAVFAKTATPIILMMLVTGLFTLVDAWFLGVFVGAEALTAVTLMFPLFMMLIATSTVVSHGFSSVMARLLGAAASATVLGNALAGALMLSFAICVLLVLTFAVIGPALIDLLAHGSASLAHMGYTYIAILVFCSPVTFAQTLLADQLRCEGRVAFMTLTALSTILLNVAFNYILIARLQWGVAGSAYGTIAAQAVALLVILVYRYFKPSTLSFAALTLSRVRERWRDYLALGIPPSLGYLGVSLLSAAIIYNLQRWSGDNYAATVGAYGITTRLITFFYLPLLGLAMAFQTIVGNNYGARDWQRTDSSLKLAMLLAFGYCVVAQIGFLAFADVIGRGFVDDPAVVRETGRILPIMVLLFFLFGPLMMLASYFQATGDAGRSAWLNLSRTYIFSLPLTFGLPFAFGEVGIWIAGPVAECLMLVLTAVLLLRLRRGLGLRWGVFRYQTS